MEEIKGKIVIGLDIGGGNLTAYVSILNNGGDPTPTKALSNEQETSVYTILKDGRKYWGDSLLKDVAASDLMEAACFKANFKALPGTGNDEDMIEFARMILENIQETTNGFYGQEPVWIIGCPSSWPKVDKGAKKKYAALFQKAGMKKVIICEESTAAISYYDKALKVVTRDNTAKGVLLIDWGSSTLDATFILPPEDGMMKRIETTGCALGAHFIDKAIIHITLYKQEAYGLGQLNDAALTQKVREKYEKDEKFRILLDCRARLMKETYFRSMAKPGFRPKSTQLRWKETINLSAETSEWGEGETFYTLGVSIQMMDDILSMPIREVVTDFDSYNEFTQNDIGNDSFIRRNERFLEELHDRYTEYARTQDALIMLTGGASQMDFIRRSVSAYFPNHKIDYDNHPELSIGKGLAYYGRETLQNPGWETLIEDEDESGTRMGYSSDIEENRTESWNNNAAESAEKPKEAVPCEVPKVQKEQVPQSLRETIKKELRVELAGELCTAFCKAFSGTFSGAFSEAFAEVYDDDFDDDGFEEEFCDAFEEEFNEMFREAFGLGDGEGTAGVSMPKQITTSSGIILPTSMPKVRASNARHERKEPVQNFPEFTNEFDRITNINTSSELCKVYELFLDEIMIEILKVLKNTAVYNMQGLIDALTEWEEKGFKVLQAWFFTDSIAKINKQYKTLFDRYGILHPLFDANKEENWMCLPNEVIDGVIKRIKETSDPDRSAWKMENIIKGYNESKRGRNTKQRYVTDQCDQMRDRLDEKKQDILSELRQMAEINSINNPR